MSSCPVCTLINPSSASKCEACGAALPSTTEWTCPFCTVVNRGCSMCTMCRAWTCETCTTINSVEDAQCVTCQVDDCGGVASVYEEAGVENDDDVVDLSLLKLAGEYELHRTSKVLRRAARMSVGLLDHIISDAGGFLRDAGAQEAKTEAKEPEYVAEAAKDTVPVAPQDEDDPAASSDDSDDELVSDDDEDLVASAVATDLVKQHGVPRGSRWQCNLCNDDFTTTAILHAHMLVRHVLHRPKPKAPPPCKSKAKRHQTTTPKTVRHPKRSRHEDDADDGDDASLDGAAVLPSKLRPRRASVKPRASSRRTVVVDHESDNDDDDDQRSGNGDDSQRSDDDDDDYDDDDECEWG